MAERVLVIDDTSANRYAMRRILEGAGYAITEGGTGGEALRLASQRPDVITLDVQLPDMLGFEVARRLKADPATATIPILQVSATFTTTDAWARGLDAGADAYLTYPVEPAVLVATVRALLRIHVAEDAAREASRQWQATFDAIRDATCLLDGERRMLRANRVMMALLHGASLPTSGAPFGALARAALGGRDGARLAAVVSEAEQVSEIELAGRWYLASTRSAPALGNEQGLVLSLGDITERKLAELERERLLGVLGEAVQAREDFLSIASHDLKGPMTGLRLAVDGILHPRPGTLEPELPPPVLHRLRLAKRQIDRVVLLIHELLDFSRLSSGRVELRLEEVDLAALARDVTERFREELASSGGSLELRAPSPVVGRWDPSRLDQVLSNLLSNAIKYGAGKPIELGVFAEGRHWKCETTESASHLRTNAGSSSASCASTPSDRRAATGSACGSPSESSMRSVA